ncbi:MAG: T9SS type A sorting domain-containing protein, partial [Candidatus Marinimicrobia bacterium]|nr:T9SS type A sorting domain-containing protein [Candidatus Neomarinimicrobiota bacterium]
VFSEETSYIYAEAQQIARGTTAEIPLRLHASSEDALTGMVFRVDIMADSEDYTSIADDIDIELFIPGAEVLVSQTGDGQISVALSNFDPPLNNEDIILGNIILPVPNETENGDTYSLTFSNVSGTNENYDNIDMGGLQNITLTVITGPPVIDGLADVAILEADDTTINFSVSDLDGSDIMVSIDEGPEYVYLNFDPNTNTGSIMIAPEMGAESGTVVVTAINSEVIPEITSETFYVSVNHYPTLNITEPIYILEEEVQEHQVILSDIDGDALSLELISAPDYVTWVPDSRQNRDITNGCDLPINNLFLNEFGEVLYNSSEAIGGFQFNVDGDGTLTSASGGDATAAGFMISASGNMALGFSLTGATFGPCGTMVNLIYDGSATSLSEFTISDGSGEWIPFEYYNPNTQEICEDESACNYGEVGDCEYQSCNDASITSGVLIIEPPLGAISGEIVFTITDNGNPAVDTQGSITVIINHVPAFDQFTDYHVPENDVLETVVYFTDFDNDPLNYTIDAIPNYVSYTELNNPQGLLLNIAPNSDDVQGSLQITLSDPGGLYYTESVSILVYETYLSSDVRPIFSGEGAGEFGDDQVVAPDVINALQVATDAPNTEMPSEGDDLFSAFDSSPMDMDINADGDYYDEGERGGDGYIEAADVIVSLLRATMIPGYENQRRVDNDYPFTSSIDNTRLVSRREVANDTLIIGHIEIAAGMNAQVPVYLQRGAGELLGGLITGVSVSIENDNVNLLDQVSFSDAVDANIMAINSGDEFISLLISDIEVQENTTQLLGYINIHIPYEDVQIGDVFNISAQSVSGSSQIYSYIPIDDGNSGSVTINSLMMAEVMDVHTGVNLKSFSVLPENTDITSVFSEFDNSLSSIIGEGVSAVLLPNGQWVGSLTEIVPTSGYWFTFNTLNSVPAIYGYPVDTYQEYNLHTGANLVSYPLPFNQSISDALDDATSEKLVGIIGEGVSAINMNDQWFGSLQTLTSSSGYWMIASEDVNFVYEQLSLSRETIESTENAPLLGFEYEQSTQQSFYFIETSKITASDSENSWIIAYNGNVVVGARKVEGEMIDIPIMGYDISGRSSYCSIGDIPAFKLYNELNGDLTPLYGENIQPFSPQSIHVLSKLEVLPTEHSLVSIYPNPFNPVTTINYELHSDTDVSISVYDIKGGIVEKLINNYQTAGFHKISWNAAEHASGIYIVQMAAGNMNLSQKVVLIK